MKQRIKKFFKRFKIEKEFTDKGEFNLGVRIGYANGYGFGIQIDLFVISLAFVFITGDDYVD